MASIFVSHRTVDLEAARRLASELNDRGHQVWLDEWEINLGDSIIQRIDVGLASAKYLILCCSGAILHSPWISREWMSTLARQLNGHGVRIVPALVESTGEVPAILADIKYVDLSYDWENGMDALSIALR